MRTWLIIGAFITGVRFSAYALFPVLRGVIVKIMKRAFASTADRPHLTVIGVCFMVLCAGLSVIIWPIHLVEVFVLVYYSE